MKKSDGTYLAAAFTAILAFLYYYYFINYERTPVVRTATGKVQGFVATSRNGRRFNLFLGIPFAEPPVEKLRFESPQPAKRWNGTLDALVHGPECKGFDFFFTNRMQGEESCLFLNVYAPEVITSQAPRKLLPVIVHIHGGGFHMASTQIYDGRYFMDHDVLLVTIQYRLGIFGFLNSNDGTVRGNMGLKDQVLALKWVQKNVANFGGDPDQVTVMGESAGGLSVHLLMLSPMAKGLFHRAITMGTVASTDFYQYLHNATVRKNYIADYFNCSQKPQEFVNCLRDKDEDTLALYHSNFITPHIFNNPAAFGPTMELYNDSETFLSENPMTLMTKGEIANKVPWMLGSNENEGLLLLGMLLRFMDVNNVVKDSNWNEVLPHLLFFDQDKRPDAAGRIKDYCFGNQDPSTMEEAEIIKRLSSMITEKMFLKPLVESAQLHAKSAPVYLYSYTYKSTVTLFNALKWGSPTSVFPAELILGFKYVRYLGEKYILRKPQPTFGPAHGDDVMLLFQLPQSKAPFVKYFDLEMSKLLVKTYADFALSRDSPVKFQDSEWPFINSSQTLLQFMELNVGKPRILQDPFKDRLKFWDHLDLPPT